MKRLLHRLVSRHWEQRLRPTHLQLHNVGYLETACGIKNPADYTWEPSFITCRECQDMAAVLIVTYKMEGTA